MAETRFDDFMYQMATECGGAIGLLDAVFGFLKRRTDFFVFAKEGDRMGFPPGKCEQLTFQTLMKWRQIYNQENPGNVPEDWPPKAKDSEVPEEVKQKQRELIKAREEEEARKKAENDAKEHPDVDIGPSFGDAAEETPAETTTEAAPVQQSESSVPKIISGVPTAPEETKEPTFDPVRQATHEDVAISTENGGETDKHKWHQEVYDVTVQVNVPHGTKGRDLNIQIKADSLFCALKSDMANPLLDGRLFDRIKVEKSFWTIEDSCTVVFNLEKFRDTIWKCVFIGDPEIDPNKVNTPRPVEEFDADTQAGIRKVLHEQERKQKGMLSIEQEEGLAKMEAAARERGQPFDRTMFMPQGPPDYPPSS